MEFSLVLCCTVCILKRISDYALNAQVVLSITSFMHREVEIVKNLLCLAAVNTLWYSI
jgi:hypothetical protein